MIYYMLNLLGVDLWQVMHWLAAIALTLILLDVFFATDVISFAGVVVLADYICGSLFGSFPIQWYIVCYIVSVMLSCAIYVFIWKKIVQVYVKKTLLRNAANETFLGGVGDSGVFRIINGNEFVSWNGELWKVKYQKPEVFHDNEGVVIIDNRNGILTIRKDR